MIIDDFYIKWPFHRPFEADTILVIDTNAELTLPIAGQLFQSIPWRNAQLVYHRDGIKQIKFAYSHFPTILRTISTCGFRAQAVRSALTHLI
jgi:hypothetical protein